jgi:uncharacterized Zn-binding protein involved in type VI secretion
MGVPEGLKQAVAAEANEPANQLNNLSNAPTAASQYANRVASGDGSLRERLTGDPTSPFDRMGNTWKDMFGDPSTGAPGVWGKFTDSWKQMGDAWAKLDDPLPPNIPPEKRADAERARLLRALQSTVAAIMGVLSVPQDLLNMGFADLTAPLAAIMPPFPAATMLMPFLGTPHCHPHPPAMPAPLPGIGMVMVGTCVRVLIGGLPAARCGDYGLHFTCASATPFFEIQLGSSNVFIGGKRSARMLVDLTGACLPSLMGAVAGKLMGALGKAAGAISKVAGVAGALGKVMQVAGMVGMVAAGGLEVAADYEESKVEDDAAMAAAKGLAAAMNAAQLAQDIAAMVIGLMMGKDPGAPPCLGALMLGCPNVLIGGIPFPNIPNPIEALLNLLGHFKPRPSSDEHGGPSRAGPDDD